MTSTDDAYRFSMDDSISGTPRTRSSSRNRKATSKNSENNTKKKAANKRTQNIPKAGETRVATRSSQKSPITPINDEKDNSFMSNINSGFSQFINPRKRQYDDKKTKKIKRPRTDTYIDENRPPDDHVDNEIQAIEQVKLVYETAGGRTNLARAAATNAQILANRTTSNPTVTNTTYIINDHNHIIEDTQADTSTIPDTLHVDTQHNDSSWQRDIDRLMKKLEEPPSSSVKSQTQIEETQIEEEHEEVFGPIYLTQTEKSHQRQIQTMTTKTISQSEKNQQQQQQQIQTTTTITQTGEIAIQTEHSQTSSSIHDCCQDVSVCPCVLRYSKLERLFMEKMSRFISIVPTVPNPPVAISEGHQKRRFVQNYSRFRRFRGRRRVNNRMAISSISNNDTKNIEEISDETTTEEADNIEVDQEQNETIPENVSVNPVENIASATITIENAQEIPMDDLSSIDNVSVDPVENIASTTIIIERAQEIPIDDLSSIEKVETTTNIDHASTLLISSTNNTLNSCSTGRTLVLTTSSLDENQKSQFRSFISRFGISTTSTIDSSTTHVIVNDSSPLVCPLTGKIIQGIARHLFIVSHRWLNQCLSQEAIIDERPYEIRGDTSLGSDHGGMRRSRLTPTYLFEKYSICLRCSSNDCAPLQTIEQVQELIELCGAKLVHHFSDIQTMDKERQMILVLGLNGFSGSEKKRKALLDTCQQFNVKCVNIHWLLISIAKFDVQSFDTYDINNV